MTPMSSLLVFDKHPALIAQPAKGKDAQASFVAESGTTHFLRIAGSSDYQHKRPATQVLGSIFSACEAGGSQTRGVVSSNA